MVLGFGSILEFTCEVEEIFGGTSVARITFEIAFTVALSLTTDAKRHEVFAATVACVVVLVLCLADLLAVLESRQHLVRNKNRALFTETKLKFLSSP